MLRENSIRVRARIFGKVFPSFIDYAVCIRPVIIVPPAFIPPVVAVRFSPALKALIC